MNKELIKITENEQGEKLVSARELHEFLEVTERFQQWFDKRVSKYDFIENEDYTGCKIFHTLANQELQDYAMTLDMSKELSMVQNNEKGKEARKYFINCEKKLKEVSQPKLPTTYKEALVKLLETIEENEQLGLENSELKEQNKLKDLENRLLSGEVFSWADTNLINSLVRTYSSGVYGDFAKGWKDFKKNLLYSHSINLNSRITAYLNKTGKKTKPKTLSLLGDDEIPNAISTIISMCKEENVDISNNLKHCLEGDK